MCRLPVFIPQGFILALSPTWILLSIGNSNGVAIIALASSHKYRPIVSGAQLFLNTMDYGNTLFPPSLYPLIGQLRKAGIRPGSLAVAR